MATRNTTLTADRLRELLDYDPETGVFTWRVYRTSSVKSGDIAGSRHTRGYLTLSISKKQYFLHRLAWLYMTGDWPNHNIDHVNGIKDDNRWCNLRDVPQAANVRNRSCTKGFYWSSGRKKYVAQATVNYKAVLLGGYDCQLDARAAYLRFLREASMTPPRMQA